MLPERARHVPRLCRALQAGVLYGGLAGLPACQGQPTPARPAILTRAQWQQDAATLTAQLARHHPGLYAHLAPASWQHACARLAARATAQPAPPPWLPVQQAVAQLRDGHTRVARPANPATYPVSFRWFPDGVYATVTRGPGQPASGLKLRRLGGVPLDTALHRLGRLVSADNEVGRLTGAVVLLSRADALAYCGLARPDSAVYELADAQGRPVRVALPARPDSAWQALPARRPLAPNAPTPLYRQSDAPFWYAALPAQQAMYVQYNRCRDLGKFLGFTWRLTRLLNRQRPTRVVLDLRFNEGGNSRQFAALRWWLAHHRLYSQRGHLFVLIGRGTFSSGLRAACELRQQAHAILVGEATGGCPTAHFTEVKSFRLPNSGLEIQYASRQANYAPDLGAARTLLPEVPAPLTMADYCQGRDPALAAALAFALPPPP